MSASVSACILHRFQTLTAIASVAWLLGCGDTSGSNGSAASGGQATAGVGGGVSSGGAGAGGTISAGSGGAAGTGAAASGDWAPCSLVEGADDGRAECREASRPFDYEQPDGQALSIHAKRLRSAQESVAQLWLLDGGPGSAGTYSLPPLMESIQARLPDVDVYTLDHRGTGKSLYLSCPDQEAEGSPGGYAIVGEEWPECVAYLREQHADELAAVTTSNSARDLAAYVEETREPGKAVWIWGGSYGTYLAHRYLQLFPNQADAVVLEAMLSNDASFVPYDYWRDAAGRRLLAHCQGDDFCRQKLPDPEATLRDLLDKLDQGHCGQLGLTRSAAKYLITYLGFYYPLNTVIPAFIYRLDRCAFEDQHAILALYNGVFGGNGDLLGTEDRSFSTVMNQHIVSSEIFWSPSFEGEDLEAYFDAQESSTLVAFDSGRQAWHNYLIWPRYEEPLADGRFAETTVPLLMLQGHFDVATPTEQAAVLADTFAAPNQHYVFFPAATHNLLSGTPVDALEQTHCAMELFAAFLRAPKEPLNTACVASTRAPSFQGYPALAQYAFGTDDLWENGSSSSGADSTSERLPTAAVHTVGARLRRARRGQSLFP